MDFTQSPTWPAVAGMTPRIFRDFLQVRHNRPFKKGERQGSKKIQDAQCIAQMRGLDFFGDAADRRFGAVCIF